VNDDDGSCEADEGVGSEKSKKSLMLEYLPIHYSDIRRAESNRCDKLLNRILIQNYCKSEIIPQ